MARSILDKLKFSRGDISRGTGISLSMVSRIFSGQRAPGTATEAKIAAYLGMRLDRFREEWTKLYKSANSK